MDTGLRSVTALLLAALSAAALAVASSSAPPDPTKPVPWKAAGALLTSGPDAARAG